MQGRTALYGPRQLLQVIAVKRRQAEGRSLADIQDELADGTDETLRKVAAVSDELLTAQAPADDAALRPERRRRFWADPPAAAEPTANGGDDGGTTLAAVSLPGGVLLVLPGGPDKDDIRAIRVAARPLLKLLAERGLLADPLSLDDRSPS